MAINEVIKALVFGPKNVVADDGAHDTTAITEALISLQTEQDEQHELVSTKLATTAQIRPPLARIKTEMDALIKRRDDITRESVAVELLLVFASNPGGVEVRRDPADDVAFARGEGIDEVCGCRG